MLVSFCFYLSIYLSLLLSFFLYFSFLSSFFRFFVLLSSLSFFDSFFFISYFFLIYCICRLIILTRDPFHFWRFVQRSDEMLRSEEIAFKPLSLPCHTAAISGLDVCLRKPLLVPLCLLLPVIAFATYCSVVLPLIMRSVVLPIMCSVGLSHVLCYPKAAAIDTGTG